MVQVQNNSGDLRVAVPDDAETLDTLDIVRVTNESPNDHIPNPAEQSGNRFKIHTWQKHNWTVAVILLFVTMMVLLFIVWANTSSILTIVSARRDQDPSFVFGGMSLVSLTLIRMLAILIGAAVAFAGLAISFFSHDKATQMAASNSKVGGSTTAATLTAYSPGIVGIAFGAVVIMTALLTKTTHSFQPSQMVTTTYSETNMANQAEQVKAEAKKLGLPTADEVKNGTYSKDLIKSEGD